MQAQNLSSITKTTEALAYASGTADRNGAILDMKGFGGVLMLAHFAAIATGAVVSIKAQQGALANGNDMADLAGTGITVSDASDDKTFQIDLRPTERYVRLVIDNDAANASAQSADYIQYAPYGQDVPITNADTEVHGEPAEGTA